MPSLRKQPPETVTSRFAVIRFANGRSPNNRNARRAGDRSRNACRASGLGRNARRADGGGLTRPTGWRFRGDVFACRGSGEARVGGALIRPGVGFRPRVGFCPCVGRLRRNGAVIRTGGFSGGGVRSESARVDGPGAVLGESARFRPGPAQTERPGRILRMRGGTGPFTRGRPMSQPARVERPGGVLLFLTPALLLRPLRKPGPCPGPRSRGSPGVPDRGCDPGLDPRVQPSGRGTRDHPSRGLRVQTRHTGHRCDARV
ncbi:hypothetical protein SAMN04489716_5177 [Actinoplanes derwentensis]|uniref:Uncharacterized protein n=1 Tax=Actinoplanes derwentensis TaxID=113562 RepID=A0A1H2C438_9ACTN|nr:hypothetical protein SAMN04489716_5177 [Actinoplanes derwentensis]